jgi:indole-3-glycerol phosphate synthase
MGVLDDILAAKRDEVTMLHRPEVRDLLTRRALEAEPTRGFRAALRRPDGQLAVIAEIKRRSPSKGVLAPDLDPATTAKAYESGGAAAISVLTDQPFFDGTVSDLQAAREAVAIPVIRKDFTIDTVQLFESRSIGADAVLLIVAALPDQGHLRELYTAAGEIGLDVLVEAHDDAELERALTVGALVVGVNCRSLHNFDEDLTVAEALAHRIPSDVIAVAESVVRSASDAERMAAAGFDAILVGEALVRADEPAELVAAMAAQVVGARD